MNDFIQNVTDQAISISLEQLEKNSAEILQNSNVSPKEVIQELKLFVKIYDNYYNLILQKRALKRQSEDISIIKQQISRLQKPVYEQFFVFQNKFNEYFGQKIQMIFVLPDEKISLMLMNNDMAHIVENTYGSLEYYVSEVNEQIIENLNYDSTTLDSVAKEIYHRWDYQKRKQKRSVGLPIIWKTNNGYDWRKVNNKGTIAEAYASFYLNSVDFVNENDMETNVGIYVTDPTYGMASVDNTLGFAIGDIERGHMQYAIKSQRAGLMGMHRIRQYLKKIENITNEREMLEAFKKLVIDDEKTRKKIKQVTKPHLDDKIKKEIENVLGDWANYIKT